MSLADQERLQEQKILDLLTWFDSGQAAQALDALATLTADPPGLLALVRAHGLPEVVRYHEQQMAGACSIIVSASEEFAHQVVEAGGLPVLVRLVGMEPHQEDAAWALGNLSAHADIAEAMIIHGALAACLGIVNDSFTSLSLCFAASSLANLAVDERGKLAIGQMDGIELLLRVVPQCDQGAAAQLTRCLANLLLDEGCRARLVAHPDGLQLLLRLLSCPDEALQESAVRALANVAFDPEQAKAVFATGAVAPIVELLGGGSTRVELQALCALRNLTADPPAALAVVQHGALPKLTTLLRSTAAPVQLQATWVVGALALQEEANLLLVQAGVLPLLEAVKRTSSDPEAKEAANQALGNLARVLTPNSRRVIQQDTMLVDRGGRQMGRKSRMPSPLANSAGAVSVVWKSPLGAKEPE